MNPTINELKEMAKNAGDLALEKSLEGIENWYARQLEQQRSICRENVTRFIRDTGDKRVVVREVKGVLSDEEIAANIRELEHQYKKNQIFATIAVQIRLK